MEALAAFIEESFVVARGGDRHVFERQDRDHLAARAARVADADRPRPAAPVADHPAVAAGADDRVGDAARAQDPRRVVDGMALGEAAQVDAHAGAGEAHGPRLPIEHEMAPADRFAGTGERFLARPDPLPIVVELADGGVSAVSYTHLT